MTSCEIKLSLAFQTCGKSIIIKNSFCFCCSTLDWQLISTLWFSLTWAGVTDSLVHSHQGSAIWLVFQITLLLEADTYQWQPSPCLLTMALIQFRMFLIIMTLDIQLLEVLRLAQALLLMNKFFCTIKTQRTSLLVAKPLRSSLLTG